MNVVVISDGVLSLIRNNSDFNTSVTLDRVYVALYNFVCSPALDLPLSKSYQIESAIKNHISFSSGSTNSKTPCLLLMNNTIAKKALKLFGNQAQYKFSVYLHSFKIFQLKYFYYV